MVSKNWSHRKGSRKKRTPCTTPDSDMPKTSGGEPRVGRVSVNDSTTRGGGDAQHDEEDQHKNLGILAQCATKQQPAPVSSYANVIGKKYGKSPDGLETKGLGLQSPASKPESRPLSDIGKTASTTFSHTTQPRVAPQSAADVLRMGIADGVCDGGQVKKVVAQHMAMPPSASGAESSFVGGGPAHIPKGWHEAQKALINGYVPSHTSQFSSQFLSPEQVASAQHALRATQQSPSREVQPKGLETNSPTAEKSERQQTGLVGATPGSSTFAELSPSDMRQSIERMFKGIFRNSQKLSSDIQMLDESSRVYNEKQLAFETRHTTLKAKYEELHTACTGLRQKSSEHMVHLTLAKNEAQNLKDKLDAATAELQSARQRSDSNQCELQSLRDELSACKAEIARLNDTVQPGIQECLAEIEDLKADKNQQYAKIVAKLSSAQAELTACIEERDRLQKALGTGIGEPTLQLEEVQRLVRHEEEKLRRVSIEISLKSAHLKRIKVDLARVNQDLADAFQRQADRERGRIDLDSASTFVYHGKEVTSFDENIREYGIGSFGSDVYQVKEAALDTMLAGAPHEDLYESESTATPGTHTKFTVAKGEVQTSKRARDTEAEARDVQNNVALKRLRGTDNGSEGSRAADAAEVESGGSRAADAAEVESGGSRAADAAEVASGGSRAVDAAEAATQDMLATALTSALTTALTAHASNETSISDTTAGPTTMQVGNVQFGHDLVALFAADMVAKFMGRRSGD